MLDIEPFLTAYDPTDLPGGSIDPLGFDRGYELFADKILPGLTNVASRPRYFSVLCAGVWIADQAGGSGSSRPAEQRAHRLEGVLRLERFWALANVLAAQKASIEGLDVGGVRGVRYVQRHVGILEERGARESKADFPLLSRQMPYGVVGIYGAVSDGMRLLNRDSMTLTDGLGEPLAEAFIEETGLPDSIAKAVQEARAVSLSTLTDWGTRAHISGKACLKEAACLKNALQQNPTRWRMAQWLVNHPWVEEDSELRRLERIARSLEGGHEDADLLEAIRAIVAFERCYRLALLGFWRLLWRCRECEPYVVALDDIEKDPVLMGLGAQLRVAHDELARCLQSGATENFRRDLHRLTDVLRFLERAAQSTEVRPFVEALLQRHTDVQRAKIAGGRPKMPWLEVHDEKIRPTIGQALRIDKEPTTVDQMGPHIYRVGTAQALLQAAGIA